MKWYACCTEERLDLYGESLIAAVHSCLANTSLEPHLIYDGQENALTRYLAGLGVRIISHRLSFHDAVRRGSPHPGFDPRTAAGAFLRFDIPLVEVEAEQVLYADIDVVFCADPVVTGGPRVLAAANEYFILPVHEVGHVFNSGVMVLNLRSWRRLHGHMVETAVRNGFFVKDLDFYDQAILNLLFQEHRDHLPPEWNWRPFAALPMDPVIIHFHTLKPFQAAALARGDVPARHVPNELFLNLYTRAVDHYARALAAYRRYLPRPALAALLEVCPHAELSFPLADGAPTEVG